MYKKIKYSISENWHNECKNLWKWRNKIHTETNHHLLSDDYGKYRSTQPMVFLSSL